MGYERTNRKHFFIQHLANLDYAIVPTSSLNSENTIEDYSNTTGAYYIHNIGEHKSILHKNKNSYHDLQKSAKKIILVSSNSGDEIDLIPTFTFAPKDLLKSFIKNEVTLFETEPINQFYLKVLENGRKKLSGKQINKMGEDIRSEIEKNTSLDVKEAYQIFPLGSNGYIQDLQIPPKENVSITKQIEIVCPKSLFWYWKEITANISYIKLSVATSNPLKNPASEQPDAYLSGVDSSFFEDISLLSYGISTGIMTNDTTAGFRWLESYLDEEDRAERVKLLQEFHKKVLEERSYVPLGFSTYKAYTRRPWKSEISKFYAGTPFWKIVYP